MTPQDPGTEQETPLTPARVLDIWRRRKWTALAIAVAVAAGAVTAALSLPDLYRASSTVVVEREVSEEFVRPSVTTGLETRIQTIHQLVTSRENLSRMIEELELYAHLRDSVPIHELVGTMRNDIELQLRGVDRNAGGNATIAFTVGYTGRDPETVAEVVNRLVDAYIQENASTRERQASRTAEVVGRELEQVRALLEEQEQQRRAFTARNTAELPQQLNVNLAALQRLNTELTQNGERQLQLIEARERMELELASGNPAPPVDPTTPGARLASLRQELATLTRTFSDEYPDVRRVRSEIAALERELGPEVSSSASLDRGARAREALEDLDRQLQALRAEEANLRQGIRRYEALVGSAPRRQVELDQLTRDYAQTQQRYELLLKQYEEAQLAATLEQGQEVEHFRVLDAAIPPRSPAAPDRLMLLLLGMAAAIGLAGIGAAAREKLDPTLHAPADLRGLVPGVPIVPLRRIETGRSRWRRRFRFAFGCVGLIVAVAFVVAGTYYVAGGNEQMVRMFARGGA